jgi:hypothetical protein
LLEASRGRLDQPQTRIQGGQLAKKARLALLQEAFVINDNLHELASERN